MKLPKPGPISKFSPTLINHLAACGFRAAFSQDPNFNDLKKAGTSQMLGLIRHDLSAKIATGAINNVDISRIKEAIGDLWDSIAESYAVALAEEWFPNTPPDLETWKKYHTRRIRAIKDLTQQVETFRESDSNGYKPPTIERRLDDPATGLYGYPDRVEHRFEGIILVDLKNANETTIKSEWHRQLLLYAHLVRVSEGDTPVAVVIENGKGERIRSEITDSDIDGTLNNALALVANFNSALSNLSSLANPDPETCQYCDFRSVCEPFWQHVGHDWPGNSVRGDIKSVEPSEMGALVIFEPKQPEDQPQKELRISPIPIEISRDISRIVVLDAGSTPNPEILEPRWYTQVFVE